MSRTGIPRLSYSQNSIHPRDLSTRFKEHFGVDLNEADLNKPLQVLHLLTVSLQLITPTSYAEIKSYSHDLLPENNSIYFFSIEALDQMAIAKFIRKTLQEIGFNEFSMRDIQRPDPIRIKRILQHIVNFVDLVQPALKVSKNSDNNMDDFIQRKLELEREIADETKFLKDITAKQNEEKLLAKKISEENDRRVQEVSANKKIVLASDAEKEETRKSKTELQQLVESKALEAKVTKEEVELRKMCIIDNPQNMLSTMNSLKNKANEQLGLSIMSKDKIKAYNARSEHFEGIKPDIENNINILKEGKQTRKNTAETKRNLPALEDILEKKEAELQSKQSSIEVLEQKLSEQREKIKELEAIQEQQRKKLCDQLDLHKREYHESMNDTDSITKLNNYKDKHVRLVKETKEAHQNAATEIAALVRQFVDGQQAMEQYISGFTKATKSALNTN